MLSGRNSLFRVLPALVVLIPALAFAVGPNRINQVRLSTSNGSTVVEIAGEYAPNFTTFKQDSPRRVIVDVAECDLGGVPSQIEGDGRLIDNIQVAQHGRSPHGISRVVIGLSREAEYRVSTRGGSLFVYITPGTGGLLVSAGVPLSPENQVPPKKNRVVATAPVAPAPSQPPPSPPAPAEEKKSEPIPQPEKVEVASAEQGAMEEAVDPPPPPEDLPPPPASEPTPTKRNEVQPAKTPEPPPPTPKAAVAEPPPPAPPPPPPAKSEPEPVKVAMAEPVKTERRSAEAPRAVQEPPRPRVVAQDSSESKETPAEVEEVKEEPATETPPPPPPPEENQPSEATPPPPAEKTPPPPPPSKAKPAEQTPPPPPPPEEKPAEAVPAPPPPPDEVQEAPPPAKKTNREPPPPPEHKGKKGTAKAVPESEARVEISGAQRDMTWVGFQQTTDSSRVFIKTNEPVKYRVVEEGDDLVVLELENTRIPLHNNRRFLDTHFFNTAVTMVTPKQIEGISRNVRVEIQLRHKVPYTAGQEDNIVFVRFERPQ